MKKIFGIIVLLGLVINLLIGCENTTSLSEEKNNFGAIPLESSHYDELSIRWGDGTLFVVDDEKIIDEFFRITSGKAYKILSDEDDSNGYLYFIKLGDLSLNNYGIMNGKYELNDMNILKDIEELLFDYLPAYNGGKLEFQSDFMPDSNLYIVVKVEKTLEGKLYFVQHHNDYGFESGTTITDKNFNPGDIVEIKTDGRLPKGDIIDINTYSIKKSD